MADAPDHIDDEIRDISDVPAVELINTVAVHLMSAAAVGAFGLQQPAVLAMLTAALSNLVSNVPAVMLLLPVASGAHLGATLDAIRGLGARAPLVALPYLAGTLLHALAWRGLLPRARRPPLLSLLGIMLSTEAMRMTLPAGPAIAESSSVLLLRNRHAIPASVGVASIAAKKALVTRFRCGMRGCAKPRSSWFCLVVNTTYFMPASLAAASSAA